MCDHHSGGRGDLCVIITAGKGDDGGDWFVDERSVIMTAMMAWMYTVRRLKEAFEVVSDIVFAEHRCRYFSADMLNLLMISPSPSTLHGI